MPGLNIEKYVNVKGISATIAALTVIVGSTLGVHAYFAKDREFKEYIKATDIRFAEVNDRLLIHQAEQSRSYVQEKIWKTQDRIEEKPSDVEAKKQLRELEAEKQNLDTRIQDLKKNVK